jgi:hypothetical protein
MNNRAASRGVFIFPRKRDKKTTCINVTLSARPCGASLLDSALQAGMNAQQGAAKGLETRKQMRREGRRGSGAQHDNL